MRHKLFTSLLFALVFVALASTAIASTTWYVNGVSGSNSNSCTSPTTACRTIKHAISLASSGDTIMVATATYTENLSIGFSLNIIGSGASTTIIDGGGVGRVVAISSATAHVTLSKFTIRHGLATNGGGVNNAGTLIINNSLISGNVAQSSTTFPWLGGGVYNHGALTINNSIVRGNRAYRGGGIFNTGGMTINRSTINQNITTGDGGGGIYNAGATTITISTISGNQATGSVELFKHGGGIFNTGGMTINRSTISGNSLRVGEGGGIANDGKATINNSTISGNDGSLRGGGIISTVTTATTRINNSSIASNTTDFSTGAGGIDLLSGTLTIQNSIVAENSGGNCFGTMTSNGYNLSSDGTCKFTGPGDMNNTNPMLGPLQYNGGPTQTMALPSGSPAVDAGNPSGCTNSNGVLLKTDQRGYPRPDTEDTGGCDIGAYEHQSD